MRAPAPHTSIVLVAHASLRGTDGVGSLLITRRQTDALAPAAPRVYALPVIAAGVMLAILYFGRVVFITAIAAVIIALILEPFVGLLVRWRIPRAVAALAVCAVALLAIGLVGVATWNQLSGLEGEAPAFRDHLSTFVNGVSDRVRGAEDAAAHLIPSFKPPTAVNPAATRSRASVAATCAWCAEAPVKGAPAQSAPPIPMPHRASFSEVRIHEDRSAIADFIYPRLGTFYEFVLMISFVPFLVYFMLSWRDHIYRSFLRFFDGTGRDAAARSLEGVAEMARAFVVGNFLIGILLAGLSWIAFAILRLPYPFLAGALSGFFSLVPYVGMPLALVPPAVAVLAGGAPAPIFLFAFFVVFGLHLIAMNVLYPKLVGAHRVHLNPLVVTFSLMFWGFLWDAPGLILAIPITAGLKAVCDNVEGLEPWGRFLGD